MNLLKKASVYILMSTKTARVFPLVTKEGATYTVSSTGKKTASVGIPGTVHSCTESIGGKKRGVDNVFKKMTKAPKAKKPFFKKWWFWLILVLALGGAAGGSGSNDTAADTTQLVQTSMASVAGQRDDAVEKQVESVVITESEAPASETKEESPEQTVIVTGNETTTQTNKETSVVTSEVTNEVTNTTTEEIEAVAKESEPITEEVVEKPVDEPKPIEPVGIDYVGNKNTKKFHYSWCNSVDQMKQSNKYFYTGTRDDMIAKGYKPCGNCHP